MACSNCDCHIVDCKCIPIPGSGTARDPFVLDVCKMQRECGCVPTLSQHPKNPCVVTFDDGHGNCSDIDLSLCATVGASTEPSVVNDLGDGVYEHVSGDGTKTVIDTCQCDIPPETITTLQVQPDGSFIYTNEDGVAVTYTPPGGSTETLTSLSEGSCGEIVYVDENGVSHNVSVTSGGLSGASVGAGPGGGTRITDDCGNFIDLPENASETLTSLVKGACGELLYTDENGIQHSLQLDANGLDGVTVNSTATGLVLEDGCGNTVDLPIASSGETLTSLESGPACGALTYTDENGIAHVINVDPGGLAGVSASPIAGGVRLTDGCGNTVDVPVQAGSETLTSLEEGQCGRLVYTDENGTTNVVNIDSGGLNGVSVTPTATGVTLTDDCGNDVDIPISGGGGGDVLTTVNTNCGTLTYRDENGLITNHALNESIFENVSGFVVNGGDDYRLLDQCGDFVDIPLGGGNGGSETLTSVSGACGVFTYVDENGNSNVIDLNGSGLDGVNVSTISGGLRLSDQCGNSVDLPLPGGGSETLTSISHNCGTLIYTDENGTPNNLDLGGNGLDGVTISAAPGGGTRLSDQCGNFIDLPASSGETLTSIGPGSSCETLAYTDEAGDVTEIGIGGAGLANATVIPLPDGSNVIQDSCGNSVILPGVTEWKTRTQVQTCEEIDPTTFTPDANDVLPQVFSSGDGTIEEMCVTGVDNGMNGTVILGLIVDGTPAGQTITINPSGVDQPFAECVDINDIPLTGAGPHTVSWFVVGGTATNNFPTSVTLDVIGTCA